MRLSKIKTIIKFGLEGLWNAIKELPEEEAAQLFDVILKAYDETAVSLNIPKIKERLIKEGINKTVTSNTKRISVLGPTRSNFPIASKLRLRRMILEITKPSRIAHIAIALQEIGVYDFERKDKAIEFFRMAQSLIGERAGSERNFNQKFCNLKLNSNNLKLIDKKILAIIKHQLKNADLAKELELF